MIFDEFWQKYWKNNVLTKTNRTSFIFGVFFKSWRLIPGGEKSSPINFASFRTLKSVKRPKQIDCLKKYRIFLFFSGWMHLENEMNANGLKRDLDSVWAQSRHPGGLKIWFLVEFVRNFEAQLFRPSGISNSMILNDFWQTFWNNWKFDGTHRFLEAHTWGGKNLPLSISHRFPPSKA